LNPHDSNSWPDLFVVPQFFERRLCDAIAHELKTAASSAATVYSSASSGAIDEMIRRTVRVNPSPETITLIIQKLLACKEAVEKHFAVTLNECEEPQFLRYRVGDFFVAHQDGNTGLMLLDSEKRRISTVIFLSREAESPEPDAYGGGSLVFSNLRNRFQMPAEPGTLVAFRSETTHEVTPVTHGERYSIASWYR
jgi:predicted 2-oxoglutarate/Fe(II)-dependent dioxygenase YbiX